MNDTIVLTKEEIMAARVDLKVVPCLSFMQYSGSVQCKFHAKNSSGCRLCKRLAEFTKGGEENE